MSHTTKFEPRDWQAEAANQCVAAARSGADRALIYACPGSGKTLAGMLIAMCLMQRVKKTEAMLVITPNLAIKEQWIDAAREHFGIELREIDDAHELQQRQLPMGVHGFIMSYQQAINMKLSIRAFCEEHRPVVLLDEVHHTAGAVVDRDGNAWGTTVEIACAAASFKLCMTGTPFREGNNPIAFVVYDDDTKRANALYRYTYEQAIRDGYCRPIEFVYSDGTVEWTSRDGAVVSADFSTKLSKKKARERREAALSTDGEFPVRMLEAAHAKLMEIREAGGEDADAGGLVVAIDIAHANAIGEVLERISGEAPLIVHNRIDQAADAIRAYRESDGKWIVGVSMLSEGVDIKRLRVGVFASRIRTPLYFQQFCGRVARVHRSRRERAFVYLPRDPELEVLAQDIEKEKFHALGEDPDRPQAAGRGGTRNRRNPVEVEFSDSEIVANGTGGLTFPRWFIEKHRQEIADFRRLIPAVEYWTDSEILRLKITEGTLKPPSEAA